MSIEERLSSLERANRNLRWGIAALVLAVVGYSFWRENELPAAPMDEKVSKVLNVERLNIMRSDGSVAAFLTSGPETAILKMGPVGQGVGLTTLPDGSSALSLDDGERVLTLVPSGISLSKRSASAVKDRERTLRRVASGEKGIPVEDVNRAFSTPPSTVTIEIIETGGGGILLRNQFGKDAVSVQVNKSNIGAIYLSDSNGKIQRSIVGE